MSKVLLMNDIPLSSKVAMNAMNPILSYLDHDVYMAPTCLISNVFNYGKYEILDTTDYVFKSLSLWNELSFDYDCVCTGYLLNISQGEKVAHYLKDFKGFKMVDPIMADHGHLYRGLSKENVEIMKKLCFYADLIVPNCTEAALLCDLEPKKVYQYKEVENMMEKLSLNGRKSIVISSVELDNNKNVVCGFDSTIKSFFCIEYTKKEVIIPGTGDLFSAVILGMLLKGKSLKEAVTIAVNFMQSIIDSCTNLCDLSKGIKVEKYLSWLD